MLSTSWSELSGSGSSAGVGFATAQHMRRVLTPLKGQPLPPARSPAVQPPADSRRPKARAVEPIPAGTAVPSHHGRGSNGENVNPAAAAGNPGKERPTTADRDPVLLHAVASASAFEASGDPGVVPVTSAILEPLEKRRPAKGPCRFDDDGDAANGNGNGAAPRSGKKRRPTKASLHREIDALWFAVSLMAPAVGRDALEEIRNRVPVDAARWDAMIEFTCPAGSGSGDGAAGSPSAHWDPSADRGASNANAAARRESSVGSSIGGFDVAAEFFQVQDAIAAAALPPPPRFIDDAAFNRALEFQQRHGVSLDRQSRQSSAASAHQQQPEHRDVVRRVSFDDGALSRRQSEAKLFSDASPETPPLDADCSASPAPEAPEYSAGFAAEDAPAPPPRLSRAVGDAAGSAIAGYALPTEASPVRDAEGDVHCADDHGSGAAAPLVVPCTPSPVVVKKRFRRNAAPVNEEL